MNEAYYCPIHGVINSINSINLFLKGHANLEWEGEVGRRKENYQGVNPENADNYRFYETQKVTKNQIILRKIS